MLTILTSRQAAKDLAGQIQAWRAANIKGYDATSWANCDSPDDEYDALYKHQSEDKWYVPVPDDMDLNVKKVAELPEGWRTNATSIGE